MQLKRRVYPKSDGRIPEEPTAILSKSKPPDAAIGSRFMFPKKKEEIEGGFFCSSVVVLFKASYGSVRLNMRSWFAT